MEKKQIGVLAVQGAFAEHIAMVRRLGAEAFEIRQLPDLERPMSWVINNCGVGWNFGRLTADGLLGVCTPVSSADAKPGDLIFFQGTYNTSGASHVGIYVGNGMMIHCGDPISYANINTSYWQQHFYTFGRLP